MSVNNLNDFIPLKSISPFEMQSTLYMPATKERLKNLLLKDYSKELPHMPKALVFCFEDAIKFNEIPKGIDNLNQSFNEICLNQEDKNFFETKQKPHLFIRVRDFTNFILLKNELNQNVLNHIDGIVLPKFNYSEIKRWEDVLKNTHFYIMPTLETEEYFNPVEVIKTFSLLKQSEELARRVLVIRLGGNDLLRCLSMRRPTSTSLRTLYDTPLVQVFNSVITQARLKGFEVTAPVYEFFNTTTEDFDTKKDTMLSTNQTMTFIKEMNLDLLQGFVGKTAIHPKQVIWIHKTFNVKNKFEPIDIEIAKEIVENNDENDLGGVYNKNQTMIEPTTHYRWAKRLVEQMKYDVDFNID